MNIELHEKFSLTIYQMNNVLAEFRRQDNGALPLSKTIYTETSVERMPKGLLKGKYQELGKIFKELHKDILKEITYAYNGNNLPETTETGKKYLQVIRQTYDCVCFNFQGTTLKPENRNHLGAWYAEIKNREYAEVKKWKEDNQHREESVFFPGNTKRTIDEIALLFAFDLDELYKTINNKLVGFEQSGGSQTASTQPNNKLKWLGSNVQLYHVLRQLKNDHEVIGNSYNSLADFLINYVTGFENTSKETIEKELKKKYIPPKNKRIIVDPNKES